ncbi:YihY/virulence factor BrkB family protein [Telmatobacter bradus]|uniref:YihY/virulence factor BrkB family protein n=1 Tax=Telmatobacter bradus TaxID=474953 RepID=UPI003B42C3F5
MPESQIPFNPESSAQSGGTMPAFSRTYESKWHRWRRDGKSLLSYLLDSEVHTFAFSVAANAILSFIPFIVLLYTLSGAVFHSSAMVEVVNDMVKYFFPSNQSFVVGSFSGIAQRHGVQVMSLVMILVACTGIFLPLEVALNQAWGVKKSRNYIMNQVVAFGLAFLMVLLGMLAIVANAVGRQILADMIFDHTEYAAYGVLKFLLLAVTTGIASILFFFSIYWLMPNCKIDPKPVLRTSIWTGIVWLISKYIFELILPHLDLGSLYGPFRVSVGLIFWAYTSGLILFAGAQFSVSRRGAGKSE